MQCLCTVRQCLQFSIIDFGSIARVMLPIPRTANSVQCYVQLYTFSHPKTNQKLIFSSYSHLSFYKMINTQNCPNHQIYLTKNF